MRILLIHLSILNHFLFQYFSIDISLGTLSYFLLHCSYRSFRSSDLRSFGPVGRSSLTSRRE